MSKAFDKVSHAKLLHRLREFGFGGNILKWFGSYLTNRYQQTTALGETSKPLPVTSGVPQGSILGPLMFLLYENHLSYTVSNSKIATFADDTKIFKTINTISDASDLQNDLSSFEESSTNVNLVLNASKCKVLRVTRKHNKIIYPYTLNDNIIESTDCERDLGILTSSDLTWSKHVDCQCAKASKTLGYVRRSTFDIKDSAVRRTLYLTLVRSQLCYGSQIWAPQTINLIRSTEKLQTTSDEIRFGSTLPLWHHLYPETYISESYSIVLLAWILGYGVFLQTCPRTRQHWQSVTAITTHSQYKRNQIIQSWSLVI